MSWINAIARARWAQANAVACSVLLSAMLASCGGGGDAGSSGGGVTSPPAVVVGSVAVSLSATTVRVGGTVSASADVRSTTGAVLTGRTITWASSDPAIATVSTAGVITGVAVGTATVTATADGKSGTAAVTIVPPPVQTVTVSVPNSTITQGTAVNATVVLRDDQGAVLTGRTVSWVSSTPAVATVDASGLVTAIGVGTTTITATSEGKSGQTTVTVIAVPVATVTVTLAQATALPGASVQASAVARAANGTVLSGRTVAWTSSSPSVATVSAAGVALAVSAGTTTIAATVDGQVGQAVLTVIPPVTSVTFNGSVRQKAGDAYPITATLRTATGTIVTRPITWRVSDPAKATITSAGVVTPLGASTFSIIAQVDDAEWSASYSSYDWSGFESGGSNFQTLAADALVSNFLGTLNYPSLNISCSSTGTFFVWISLPHIITQNGVVAYALDGGASVADSWSELSPDYKSLWKIGSNTNKKAFAILLALSRRFTFAFGEYASSVRVADFRVTGLTDRLTPLLALCPAAIRAGDAAPNPDSLSAEMARLSALVPSRGPQASASEAQRRAQSGPAAPSTRLLDAWPVWKTPDTQVATRLRR